MQIDLGQPIDPESETCRKLLEQLQGNILKGHGRDHTALILISLRSNPEDRAAFRAFAGKTVTSAQEQSRQSARRNETGGREVFGNLFLSVWGYLKLGYPWSVLQGAFLDPDADSGLLNWFLLGMEHTGWALADPPRTEWEPQYFERQDAMLLLACSDRAQLELAVADAKSEISGFGTVLGDEWGRNLYRSGKAIEHFGFADGISQTNFFAVDPAAEGPSRILFRDALAGNELAFGSFLVYRKLEQNVKAFRDAETSIATAIGLNGNDTGRAGAMMIGRFRDGTPLVDSHEPLGLPLPDDHFDFTQDPVGARCPFHAHIRKMNPDRNKESRMVRRGVPYGSHDPTQEGVEPPERGNGLLFLSFQRDIHVQFGEVQKRWANFVDSPKPRVGQDPLIGQGKVVTKQKWPLRWGDASAGETECEVGRLVTLKGGEYFFAPSLAFFGALGP
ncbi:MAG: Dyp-type peroxidase [Paludibaculum sp.]